MDMDFRPYKRRATPAPARRASRQVRTAAPVISKPIKQRRRLRMRKMPVIMSTLVAVVIAAVMALLPMLTPSGVPQAILSKESVKLSADKLIYRTDQRPTFRLSMPDGTADNALGWMGLGQVYASADKLETTVIYGGHTVDIPATIKSLGAGKYSLALNPKGAIKPGKYSLQAKITSGSSVVTQSQDFAWGVLAVNTTKAAYAPGETAVIYMAVLSSRGNTLCDAPLKLTITSPDGTSAEPNIEKPENCHADSYTDIPDYSASYPTTQAGEYQMKLQLADSDYVLTDTFRVDPSVPFAIERTGPTRLFPPSPYSMKLRITPTADYQGRVVEGLPAGFTVVDSGQGIMATASDGPTLTWNVDWKQGETHELSYSFKAPIVSPAFYFFRPLMFKTDKQQTAYQEARRWQIAGDSVITYVKDTPEYGVGGTTSYTNSTITSTTGNTLVLMMQIGVANATTPQLTAISDSASNTWVLPSGTLPVQNPPAATSGSSTAHLVMAYALNATAVTSVTFTIGGAYKLWYDIAEFSNVATSSAVDQSAANSAASATSQTSPSLTTVNAADLIIGGVFAGASATSVASNTGGFTAIRPTSTDASNNRLGMAYQVVSSTGTYSDNFTLGTARAVSGGLMAFTTASAGCTPTTTDLMRGGNYFCSGAKAGFFWAT